MGGLSLSAYSPVAGPLTPPRPLRAQRILVVDDDPLVRAVIEALLQADGHTVATAPDGHAAWLQCRTAAFDVVVTDLVMPGMSGLDLVVAIKSASPSLPVILLTGNAAGVTADVPGASLVDVVLAKPASGASLRAAVTRVLASTPS